MILLLGEWIQSKLLGKQSDKIWLNFATLAIFEGLFSNWQNLESSLAHFNAIRQIFIVKNGKILHK